MLYNYHQAVSDYGTIDLYSYSILTCTPKPLDFEVLFEPFKEQFYTPSVAIKVQLLQVQEVQNRLLEIRTHDLVLHRDKTTLLSGIG